MNNKIFIHADFLFCQKSHNKTYLIHLVLFFVIFTTVFIFSLQIIRGQTLFKLPIYDEQFALFVNHSQMDSLELPALRDILSGSVFIFNNQNLCFIQTINWEEIITGKLKKK